MTLKYSDFLTIKTWADLSESFLKEKGIDTDMVSQVTRAKIIAIITDVTSENEGYGKDVSYSLVKR